MKMNLLFLLLLTSTANAATWYVSPTGNDGNIGTLAEPFLTIQKGHDVAVAGDTIYVRGGTYESSTEVTITRDGVSGNPIRLLAYPNERPIIDGINLTNNGTSDILRGKPLRLLGASWWVIDGFEIKRGSSGGIIVSQASNNNIIRRLDVHHNGQLAINSGTGVMLHDRSGNNLIENSDSHNNRNDQGTSPGGNADGFATVLVGPGNVLRNNRAWQNSDDGYDAFNGTNGVAFEGNFAFENGYNESLGNAGGNGTGFKLGGQKTGFVSGSNIVTNNLSWRNKQHGFYGNGANTPNTIINNTAWDNGNTDFIFTVAVADVLRNNLSFTGGIAMHAAVDDEFNSWNLPITINAADFESLVDTIARGPRRADGSLPASGFLHLATDSDLIDQGTDVGLSYSGTAPDLGAYEAASGLPTVTVAATDPTATEAGVTTGTVVVSRTGSTAAALTVNYTVSGAATPGSDYTALTGSVTIPAAAASATITVTPINDTAAEPNETVMVSLSPDGAYVVGAPGSATVTIVSDDVAPTVNAGPDQTITLPPGTASLSATAMDDGLPGPMTFVWTGPPGVTFSPPGALSTTATFPAVGSYTLTLTADDGALTASDSLVVTVDPASPNQPPTVDAGADQPITLPSPASLAGTADDDGVPNPTLVTTWSMASGPGTVTFGNASALSTTATFSVAGVYELRLTADDGALTASDSLVVTVDPAPPNQPPTVDAGADQPIILPSPASLAGTADDDGVPNPTLVTTWSMASGPGTVTFGNASALSTTATFSVAGLYELRLTADDGALTASDIVVITANPGPVTTEVRVAASADDAEEKTATGKMSLTSSDLNLTTDGTSVQIVGMRFRGVPVPKGAAILNAYVQFKVDEISSAAASLTVQGQAADTTVAFNTATRNVSLRPRTGASVPWTPAAWPTVGTAGPDQRTPNIASVIQEIVNRSGWASSNSLVILISGTGKRVAEAYNGDQAGAPLLHVEYK